MIYNGNRHASPQSFAVLWQINNWRNPFSRRSSLPRDQPENVVHSAARVGYFVPLNGPLNGHPPSNLLRSYLANMEQFVELNDTASKTLPIVTGVPQGSILGPLLYLI